MENLETQPISEEQPEETTVPSEVKAEEFQEEVQREAAIVTEEAAKTPTPKVDKFGSLDNLDTLDFRLDNLDFGIGDFNAFPD